MAVDDGGGREVGMGQEAGLECLHIFYVWITSGDLTKPWGPRRCVEVDYEALEAYGRILRRGVCARNIHL